MIKLLLVQTGQELFRANFFCLKFVLCVLFCFVGRFDHVTSYFGFSCHNFDRLLCARTKVCDL